MGFRQALWNSRYWLAGLHVLFLLALGLVYVTLVMAAFSLQTPHPGLVRDIAHSALKHAYVPFIFLVLLWLVAWLMARQSPLELTRSEAANSLGMNILQYRLDNLCIARNLPRPELFITDYAAINALIWGRDELRLYVTKQACEQLTKEELDALMAQQLGHLSEGDNHIFPLMSLFIMIGSQIAVYALGALGLICANSPDTLMGPLSIPTTILGVGFGLLWVAFRYYGAWYGRVRRFAADLIGIELCQNAWALISLIERAKNNARWPILPDDWRALAFLDPDPILTLPWYPDPDERILDLRQTLGISMFGQR